MCYQVSKDTTIRVQPGKLQFGNEYDQQAVLFTDPDGRLHVQLHQDGHAIAVRFTATEVQLIRDLIK